MKKSIVALGLFALSAFSFSATIFNNVNVFDGKENKLYKNFNVKIDGNEIVSFTKEAIKSTKKDTVINGKGKTLMPGLIDMHVHPNVLAGKSIEELQRARWDKIGAQSLVGTREWFLDGFTTVRGMGGTANGLKKVIDEGFIEGPRIYPSRAYISQTAGHGDFVDGGADLFHKHGNQTNLERLGVTIIADGEDEVRKAARWNFGNGASQLKIMAGGGVSSKKDPLFVSQFTDQEIKAIVEEAEARDTYVAAHLYNDKDISRNLDLGVLSFEHAHFITEKTAKKVKKKGAYLSVNLAGLSDGIFQHPVYGGVPQIRKKVEELQSKSGNLIKIIKKVQPKVVFNTDIVLEDIMEARKHRSYEIYAWGENLGNFTTLKAMTSTAGELLAKSGKSNPYPGKLGVIEEGALADIIIVDGNPLEDLSVIGANPDWFKAKDREAGQKTIKLIMKDGKIYKNTL